MFWIWWQVCDKHMYPTDPGDPRARMTHEVMRTWPWRLVGYSNLSIDGVLVLDPREMDTIRSRGLTGRADDGNGRFSYPDTSYPGTLSEHTAFGMNGV